MTHTPPADLLEKAKHWRNDIAFTQDVLGTPMHFSTTWEFSRLKNWMPVA